MSRSRTSEARRFPARVSSRIPHSRPTLNGEDERLVAEAVASGTLVSGERTAKFETELARFLGRGRAVTVTSGSAALHLALAAIGVGPGDQVAVPSYACVSLLQAVRRANAEPVLIDCDPTTYSMDPEDLRRRLTSRIRATILVHNFGIPLNPEPFLLGPTVIEDIATALGARRFGRPVGADGGCVVCSFNATKMITTGGGGALLADDPEFISRAEDLIDYDDRGDAAVRYNERMGEIPAALGLSQLGRISDFLERRRRVAAIYREELDGNGLILPRERQGCEPAWHRFVVRVKGGAQWIRAQLSRHGIDSPRPVHQPLHWILGRGGYPGAETAHREALSLPIYPLLEEADARRVAREVKACLDAP
jgi:dTDP-4-amino-4,6-dideoxygalactose transaminase